MFRGKPASIVLALMLSAIMASNAEAAESVRDGNHRWLLFHVKVAELGLQSSSLAKGKAASDFVDVSLPGQIFSPPVKLALEKRSSAKRDTPLAAAASDFSANKTDDAKWMLEDFATEDRTEIRSFLDDKGLREANRRIFQRIDARYVSGEANYRDYVLLFVREGHSPNPAVMTLEKTPEGYKRTNALSKDETFDVVWSALRNGEVRALKQPP